MAASRSSARLSAKTAKPASLGKSASEKPANQKAAVKPAKSSPSVAATLADSCSDMDNDSDIPLAKRRRTNSRAASKKKSTAAIKNTASAETSEAVSPASFEFSRAGTTETAATSGSGSTSWDRNGPLCDDDEEYDFGEEQHDEDSMDEAAIEYSSKAKGKRKAKPLLRSSSGVSSASRQGLVDESEGEESLYEDDEISSEDEPERQPIMEVSRAPPSFAPRWADFHNSFDPVETPKQRLARLEMEYGGLEDEEYEPNDLSEEDPDFPRIAFLPNDPHNTNRSRSDRAALYRHHPELKNVWRDLGRRCNIKVRQDPQPPGLALELLPFQREGLHWMRVQEKGIYKGGILADEMGMGKTIQTLALVMTDPNAGTNLVVAPTVALMQWKSEIEKYTGDALKVYLFHGASRATDSRELSKYHVVLTSYNILESVYRKQQTGYRRRDGIVKEDSVLHKVKYHRVILDEAHSIKDRTSNTAKAVFALKTKYKLCLSGTPLQNRIGELFSLLRFLEIDPFAYYYCRKCSCKQLQWKFTNNRNCDQCGCSPMCHLNFFNYECLKPIQRDGNEGVGRIAYGNIRQLLKHIMLRRTKNEREDDLGLPNKVVRIRRDKFSEEELDLYDSIYSDGKRKFETYARQGVVLNNYANIFTLITRMRQMADHPDLVLRKHAEEGQLTLVCGICDEEAEEAINSKCHHTYCRDCVQRYVSGFCGDSAPECPKCHIPLVIDLAAPALEASSYHPKQTSIVNRIDMTNWRSSTKIEALCHELYRLRRPYQTTKSIVFSQFTSMLQLIEWRLNHAGFKTVMLQGSMSPAQRDATIQYFMTHVEVEVFLVSLKAGGVALNLIEANHVFLMEPWWNPSVEWQAADRIHRIGQTRVCTVTRMVVEDSIESRIIELQEKKTRMIEATVNADQKAMERLTADDMRFLFQN